MDISKKQEFVRRAGKKKLMPPNIVHKKLDFVHDMTKTGLEHVQHFDTGGTPTVNPTPSQSLPQSTTTNPQTPGLGTVAGNWGTLNFPNLINNAGGAMQSIASDFTAQNGYNASLAPTNELNYDPTIEGASNNAGVNNNQYNQNLGEQENLAGTLEAESHGQGPNPAQAQLDQNTATNVANQAALAAGQRGASANIGLQTRQAAQTGAGVQQQAVGQEATTQANQELGEQQQEGQVLGQAGSQITGEQNANTNTFAAAANANNAENNTNVSNYGMAQGINSQVAQSNANAVNNTTSGLMGGASSVLSMLSKGGEVEKPNVNAHKKLDFVHKMTKLGLGHFEGGGNNFDEGGSVSVPAPTYSTPNLGAAQTPGVSFTGKSSGDSSGGGGGGGGGMAGLMALMAKGGNVPASTTPSAIPGSTALMSVTPDDSSNVAGGSGAPNYARGGDVYKLHPSEHHAFFNHHFTNYFSGGESKSVPAMVSPGERYLSPKDVHKVVHEGANPMKLGTKIPGKAKVKNDSLKNDNVPMTLEVGGMVIPRHITEHKMAPDKAALFVHRALARKKAGRS